MGRRHLKTPARAILVACFVLGQSVAYGGEVRGTVHVLSPEPDAGQPAQAAQSLGAEEPIVVYLTGFRQPPADDTPVIAQKNKTFAPNLRVIVAGQSIQFTNDDKVVHNVFSTSKARPFDIGKPRVGETRSVKFPNPGLVDVYCNIHETMSATVLVLPNQAFNVADAEGRFTIKNVPPGHYPLYVWGPHIEPFQTEVTVPAGKAPALDLVVTPRLFTPAHLDKYGLPYRDRKGYGP
jgi:plastocyanin